MNRRGRLDKVAAALAPPRWPSEPFDVKSASNEELLAILADDDAELTALVRQCFAEHPSGGWIGATWPDHKCPGQCCRLSAYLFGHPQLGNQADAAVARIAQELAEQVQSEG